MAYQPTLLFFGAGANVGAASVALFKNKGYKVASVARTVRDEVKAHSDLVLTANFNDPSCLKSIFEQVEKELGIPSVIVYNAYSWSRPSDDNDPLSTSVEGVQNDFAVNSISLYAAAQEAIKGFEKLPQEVKKTFIFTGNRGSTVITPDIFLLAWTKSASWYLIQTLVATTLFQSKGYRFYFADERCPDGKGMRYISGSAHAELYVELAEKEDQGPPLATFVRGKGYVAFDEDERASLPVVWRSELANEEYGAPGTEEWNYGKGT
ncbi:hypothetical protein D0Z07_6396 [Hyphodiscus hymeniophilus]|uniref:NAD(P)-binding protein n=1 Tax=Hyphodiscus hymeniophilus TaxID=353542 RepID=A0A9P6VFA8_9HELO|nr:hypothetical protein D0Z07_6396 [Hyphodiscus hymeniophilus]